MLYCLKGLYFIADKNQWSDKSALRIVHSAFFDVA